MIFSPAIWLSGRLTFSRKYLLIGVVFLLALSALSLPLWEQVHGEYKTAQREVIGLNAFRSQYAALAELVILRDHAVRGQPSSQLARIDDAMATVATSAPFEDQKNLLEEKWQSAKSLDWQADSQLRFAYINEAVKALLALTQSSARHHRLNVDHELDATFDMLTSQLPLLLDYLCQQRDALALNNPEMTRYALAFQIAMSESLPRLKTGIKQLQNLEAASEVEQGWLAKNLKPLMKGEGNFSPAQSTSEKRPAKTLKPVTTLLQDSLEQLEKGILKQQDTADKTLDDPQAVTELQELVEMNQLRTGALLKEVARAVDRRLALRMERLYEKQWLIAFLLVGTLGTITYLFVGIYLSTLHSLKSLSAGTNAFCAGNLGTRIEIDTADELVLVARNFNSMAAEFSLLMDVIQEQNETREHELAEKNEQLRAAGERMHEELLLGSTVQLAILPQSFPNEVSWGAYACMFAARELGGDFFDWFKLPDGRCGALVADVSGKGLGAAFFMAVSRTLMLDLAIKGAAPSRVLAEANNLLCERNPMDLFVTVCYGIFDPRDGSFVFASAGHPPPLLRRSVGTVEVLPSKHDLALAILPDMTYQDLTVYLDPGDNLLLYTDGVTDAESPDQEAYGNHRLRDWFANIAPTDNPHAMINSLVADVEKFVAGAEAADDLTCLVLCRKLGAHFMESTSNSLSKKKLLLDYKLHPTRLEEIEKLAAAVSSALSGHGDLAFKANLCLDELITNTICHGLKGSTTGNIHLLMSMSDEKLEIILKDDAPPFDPFIESPIPNTDLRLEDRQIGGLGVHLVKSLMDDSRSYYDGSGNLTVLLKSLSTT